MGAVAYESVPLSKYRMSSAPTMVCSAVIQTSVIVIEHEMLALMSGRASAPGEAAQRVGRAIERAARTSYVPRPTPRRTAWEGASLVKRLKAVLAA